MCVTGWRGDVCVTGGGEVCVTGWTRLQIFLHSDLVRFPCGLVMHLPLSQMYIFTFSPPFLALPTATYVITTALIHTTAKTDDAMANILGWAP